MSGGPRHQGGFAVVGLLVMMIATGAFLFYYAEMRRDIVFEQEVAAEGTQLAQGIVALRGAIADQQAGTLPIGWPGPNGTATGFEFLKPPSCGGHPSNPPNGYLPCSYQAGRYGNAIRWKIDIANDPNNGVQVSWVGTFRANQLPGRNESTRTLVAQKLLNAILNNQTAAFATFVSGLANVPITDSDRVTPPTVDEMGDPANWGNVLVRVDTNPNFDLWLRVDGTNRMRANLNMGGFSIGNARDGDFQGNLRVSGRAQIDEGLISRGVVDAEQGIFTTDVYLNSVRRFASQAIYDVSVVHGGNSYIVNKPDCSNAGGNPQIYAAMQSSGSINDTGIYRGDALYDSFVQVVDRGESWQIVPRVRGTQFGLTVQNGQLVLTKRVNNATAPNAAIVLMRRCA